MVATTCHLYPEAMEGLTLPDGDGPHEDCADAMAAGRNEAANQNEDTMLSRSLSESVVNTRNRGINADEYFI